MNLQETVRALMKDGKGILAFDQSPEILNSELAAAGSPATEEMRAAFREVLFTTEGINRFLSGVTLSEEGLVGGSPSTGAFHNFLAAKNILVGIELEHALLDGSEEYSEKIRELIGTHRSSSLAFLEWRMVVGVGNDADESVREDIRKRIEFVKICHSENIVPIVEVDVDMNGPHTAAQAEESLTKTLALVSDAFESAELNLKATIIKTSMAVTGVENPLRAEPKEVGGRTVHAVNSSLSEHFGGVVFLSGVQKPEEAAANFNAIARMEPFSWPIAFSFTGALLSPVIGVWRGEESNRGEAQALFIERLSLAQLSDRGGYDARIEESELGKL